MGFLDKLKDVAKNASEQIAKAGAEKEKQSLLDALDDCGSVKGANIPDGAWFCMDETNKRIVIRTGIINNHHNLICEYGYDDVSVFKLNECTKKELASSMSTFSYLKFVLNSGEELEVCNIVYNYGDADVSEYNKQREAKSKERVMDIILAFADKAEDNETIKWANGFLEANGYSNLLEYLD